MIEAAGLTKRFKPGLPLVLEEVHFQIGTGETVGLVGSSGSGKTTLGRILIGILPPDQGTVRYRGEDVWMRGLVKKRWYRRLNQMVLQDPLGALNPLLTLGELLEEGLCIHRREMSLFSVEEIKGRVNELLELIELSPTLLSRYPREISGGQRQKVAIARALAIGPDFLTLDEPFSSLDVISRRSLTRVIRAIQQESSTSLLIISHDLHLIDRLCSRVYRLNNGKLHAD